MDVFVRRFSPAWSGRPGDTVEVSSNLPGGDVGIAEEDEALTLQYDWAYQVTTLSVTMRHHRGADHLDTDAN